MDASRVGRLAERTGVNSAEGITLILVTAGAVAMPAVARRLAVPVAVAEILFGLALGRSGLGLEGAGENGIVRLLGDLGFALFLFVAGMEIQVRDLASGNGRGLVVPLVGSVITLGVAIGSASFFGWSVWIGLAAGATSVPLMATVLRELGLSRAPVAQRMFAVAGVGELVTIAVVAAAEVVMHAHSVGAALLGGARALVPVGATVVCAVVLRTLLWWYPAPIARILTDEDPQELGMRVGMGLLALFVGLAALGGIEPLLGAFVAGLLVSYVLRDRGTLEHKLAGMAYGFFVPIFFIGVGMRVAIAPRALLDDAGFVFLMLGVMLAARVPVGMLLALTGSRSRDSAAATLLLAAPLTLMIAVVDLGVRAGSLAPETEGTAIAVALFASLLFPALARVLLRSGRDLAA